MGNENEKDTEADLVFPYLYNLLYPLKSHV